MSGFVMLGFVMFGFVILGFVALTLVTFRFVILGFVMLGLRKEVFVIFGLVMLGLVMLGLVIFGLVLFGLVISGLRVAEDESPLFTMDPPTAVICVTFTVIVAVAFVEVANTLRDTEEYGGMVMSRVVKTENCKKDAVPPGGWLAIVKRTLRD